MPCSFAKTHALIVDQGGVLDGVDAGQDGPLDALCAMRVGGDLAACGVGGVRGHLQFFEAVLRSAGLIAFAQHPARGEDLDHIDAIFHLGADSLAHLLGAVGDPKVTLFREHHDAGLRRIIVQVAVAAGDGYAWPGSDDARARE